MSTTVAELREELDLAKTNLDNLKEQIKDMAMDYEEVMALLADRKTANTRGLDLNTILASLGLALAALVGLVGFITFRTKSSSTYVPANIPAA